MKWVISVDEFISPKPKKGLAAGQPPRLAKYNTAGFNAPDNEGIVTLKNRTPDIDECYLIYNSKSILQAAIKSKFHVWVTYKLPNKYPIELQKNYQCFCGGWLQFYDLEVSCEKSERFLFLDWSSKAGFVVLYISNGPKRKRYKIVENCAPCADSDVDPPPPPQPPPPEA